MFFFSIDKPFPEKICFTIQTKYSLKCNIYNARFFFYDSTTGEFTVARFVFFSAYCFSYKYPFAESHWWKPYANAYCKCTKCTLRRKVQPSQCYDRKKKTVCIPEEKSTVENQKDRKKCQPRTWAGWEKFTDLEKRFESFCCVKFSLHCRGKAWLCYERSPCQMTCHFDLNRYQGKK